MSTRGVRPDTQASSAKAWRSPVSDAAGQLLALLPDHAFLQRAVRASSAPDRRIPSGAEGAASSTAGWIARAPWERICTAYGLSPFEQRLLILAVLPELDAGFGDAIMQLQAPGGLRRLTMGSAVRVLHARAPMDVDPRASLAQTPLWRAQLLLRDDPLLPFFDQVLCPTHALVECLLGCVPQELAAAVSVTHHRIGTTGDPALVRQLSPSLRLATTTMLNWLRDVSAPTVHLRAGPAGDGTAVVTAVAEGLGRGWLQVRAHEGIDERALRLAELCSVAHALPVGLELSPDAESLQVPERPHATQPLIVLTGLRCRVGMTSGVPLQTLTLRTPRASEQAAVWRHYLGPAADGVPLALLATRKTLSRADIASVVARAAARARAAGRSEPDRADVTLALNERRWERFPELAQARTPRVRWDFLVLDDRPRALFEDLVHRVEHHLTVQDRWRMRDPGGRGQGLLALLYGEPGTGKTLGAEAVASRLQLPLLTVDLSRVVSKYVGETEKNLSRLFDAAEGFGAVLFFDEADALFGRRTQISDSHDRYANIEISYLLHRLDDFEGIALLATNLLQNMDEAFMRRLQCVIQVPRPTQGLQRMIWERHLPSRQLAEDVDLGRVVQQYDLVGGEIRNASLTAAYAAAAVSAPITPPILERAIRQELVKSGRSAPSFGGTSP